MIRKGEGGGGRGEGGGSTDFLKMSFAGFVATSSGSLKGFVQS